MRRDHGWIHTLLEEAENERMHMLVFTQAFQPTMPFRLAVLASQGVFWNAFFLSYLISPTLCHRFVGYLEEEAVHTYSSVLDIISDGKPEHADLKAFGDQKADPLAIRYWRLHPDATMRDVILAVRRDEANHRDVNHTFAGLHADLTNPFVGKHGPK